ncbi:MAG TPA: hypothetical protein VGG72_13265 [Bryobacteraceae bacterium]|jgi:tetratricopeptide (TPR) repeat protein
MRRFGVPFAVLYVMSGLILAPVMGQMVKIPQLTTLARAEDSPEAATNNQIFYNSPHTPDPQMSEPAGTVSVEQLQHPVSGKGAKLLKKAQNLAAMGDHNKAIDELKLALKERSAVPYAYSLLGTEYLRLNQVPAAIGDLEQAVKLLPRSAINHANLGYALYLMGSVERAELEIRRALDLDGKNETTRRVFSVIMRARGSGQ